MLGVHQRRRYPFDSVHPHPHLDLLVPYSVTSDLLLGDMTISSSLDQQRYVNDAADEIDSTLGGLYVLPIDKTLLTERSKLILKRINNWLATGQIVCTLAIASEDKAMNAYGMSMLKDARALLMQVASGAILLEDAVLVEGDEGSTGPRVVNVDSVSANAVFEDTIMTWHPEPVVVPWGPPGWQPGSWG